MKICAISDTHKQHKYLKLPSSDEVDTLIHAGDFSAFESSFYNFLEWFSSLDFKNKILIAGNHDNYVYEEGYQKIFDICKAKGVIYLEDSSVEIDGIKFYGSPWSLRFGTWDFMVSEERLAEYWGLIPADTHVLITHTPAYKEGDRVNNSYNLDRHVGSKTLKQRLEELSDLKLHIYGHIHEAYGIHTAKEKDYISYNASSFDYYKTELNLPMVFEV